MSARTGISWCDSTWNPWIGCTNVSPACDNCYAERDWDKRKHRVKWGAGNPRSRTSAANWKLPERWNRERWVQCSCGWRGAGIEGGDGCGACGKHSTTAPARRRVFCASLADWLDNEVPIEWLVDLLGLVRCTPNLDWLLLSKRIGNWRSRLLEALRCPTINDATSEWIFEWLNAKNVPPHAWIGATMESQDVLDRDFLKLLKVPAVVRFLSIEPMLSAMNLGLLGTLPGDQFSGYQLAYEHLHWVIVGGESGPHARPTNPAWVRSLRDECAEAGVPFHFKQWGEWREDSGADPIDDVIRAEQRGSRVFDDGNYYVYRFGKKAAGRMLDGRTWDEFPDVDAVPASRAAA